MTGSALYERTIAFDHGDPERNALMRKVWSPTPWMLHVETGEVNGGREREIRRWLHDNLGDECRPIHGLQGLWQLGSCTLYGWNWIGFTNEADMRRFQELFGGTEERR